MKKRLFVSSLWLKFFLFSVLMVEFVLQGFLRRKGIGVLNEGVSFGLFPGIGMLMSILIYLGLVVMFFMVSKKEKVAMWFILVGGLGNLVPRIIFGSVWDYIYAPFLPFQFNLSDVFITTGVILYILSETVGFQLAFD